MLAKKIIRLCAVMVLSGVSSVAVSQTFTFTDALALIDDEGVIVVPDTYTSIGNSAFKYTMVVEVTLPETIQSIGTYAFANTPNLRKINIPTSITNLPEGVFSYSGIEEITIPSSVNTIGQNAFNYSGLKIIDLPNGLGIGQHAFLGSSLEHVKIGDDTSVGYRAFAWLPLISLEIGENTSAEYNARVFDRSNSVQTIVSASTLGCEQCYNGLTFADNDLSNLKIVVLKGGGAPRNLGYYYQYNSDADLYVDANISTASVNTSNSRVEFKSVTVIAPFELDRAIAIAPHGVCSLGDNDNDGYNDCYDQFPNDPDRWFDYSDSAETNTTNLVHSDSDGLADIFDEDPTSSNYVSGADTWRVEEHSIDTDGDGYRNSQDIDDDDDGLLDIYEPFFGTNPLIPDSDFDGTLDGLDAFPLDNTESLDTDSDGVGNNADTDDDNDGHFDLLDAFPLDATEWMDSDLDGVGNNADTDDDNDGVLDEEDAFPYTASESVDTDGDGVGDNSDAFPNDSSETLDTDLDGIGNNADTDDDNDGVADADDSDPLNDAIGALESQNLFVMGNPVAVNGYLATISVAYDVSDDNNQLNGIGFRVHYDSSIYSYSAVQNTLSQSVVVDGMGPYQDVEDFDNDSTTDSYILYGWAAVSGDWPNVELPVKLSDIEFFVNWADYEAGSTTSNINFSVVSNNEGYEAKTTNYAMTVLPATWDFDGNGSADALTDGLMLLRYTFGIQDLRMTESAISPNATLSATQVVEGMTRALQITDIDGNGSTDALTDGLMLMRYLFGLRGDALILDSVSSDATRTIASDIEQYIALYMPDNSLIHQSMAKISHYDVIDNKAYLPRSSKVNWVGLSTTENEHIVINMADSSSTDYGINNYHLPNILNIVGAVAVLPNESFVVAFSLLRELDYPFTYDITTWISSFSDEGIMLEEPRMLLSLSMGDIEEPNPVIYFDGETLEDLTLEIKHNNANSHETSISIDELEIFN